MALLLLLWQHMGNSALHSGLFLAAPLSLRNLSPLTSDWNLALSSESPNDWTARKFPTLTFWLDSRDVKSKLGIIFTSILFFFIFGCPGSYCCTRAFSSCGKWELLFLAVSGILIAVASLISEHRLWVRVLQWFWHIGSVVVEYGLTCFSACGNFPDQGSNLCPPALAGRFLSIVPPGKSFTLILFFIFFLKKFIYFWLLQVLVVACGILLSRPGFEPACLHWKADSLTTGPPRKPIYSHFKDEETKGYVLKDMQQVTELESKYFNCKGQLLSAHPCSLFPVDAFFLYELFVHLKWLYAKQGWSKSVSRSVVSDSLWLPGL